MAQTQAGRPLGALSDFAPWADPDAAPLIRYRGVTKRFDDFVAVDDVSLDIYEREFFALLGPSGCGKTTLMRMLAGFEQPSAGAIELDGADLADAPPNARPVNMMFQSYALFPHLSVEGNIAFGLKRARMDKGTIEARVQEMLALTQLERFAKRKPHQLSGGQRQRVALARALARRPKLVLLDEPLGALDKKLRQETQFELMNIQEKLGATFMIVTHDQEEAMTVASRIAVMNKGEIAQVATPTEIYEAPNSRYVASFLGEVNLFEGEASPREPGMGALVWAEGASPLRAPWPEGARAGRMTLAVRPEKIAIEPRAPGGPAPENGLNHVLGEVEDIAYSGNLSTYLVRLENGALATVQEVNRRGAADRRIAWEEPVRLGWRPDAGVLLER